MKEGRLVGHPRSMRLLTLASWILEAGCSPPQPVGLPEVPISGGTPAQRAIVETELAAFEEWTGGGRVMLSSIRIRRLRAVLAGKYRVDTPRVFLDDDLGPEQLANTLRHELCHAVDWQEDLAGRPVPALDVFMDVMADAADERGLDRWFDPDEPDELRREIFARACELGPWVAGLAQLGPDEPLSAALSWIADEVWTHRPTGSGFVEGVREDLVIADFPVVGRVDLSFGPTTTPEVIEVMYGRQPVYVELHTGRRVFEPHIAVPDSLAPGGALPGVDRTRWSVQHPELGTLAVGSVDGGMLGRAGEFWIRVPKEGPGVAVPIDEDAWPPPQHPMATFTSDGAIWAVEPTDDTVGWFRLTAR
ncbi:MAG: hypothetical protein AAF602_00920 [Myxococcota bacterium]